MMKRILFTFLVLNSCICAYSQILYDSGPIVINPTRDSDIKWNKDTLTFYIYNYSFHLTYSEREDAINNAFNTWSRNTSLVFIEESNPNAADLKISWNVGNHGDGYPFGANDLAHAFFPPPTGGDFAGQLHFNDSFMWKVNGDDYDLQTVALHEIGHLLGLDHSSDINSIMYPSYNGIKRNINISDFMAIANLYGYPFDILGDSFIEQQKHYYISGDFVQEFTVTWSINNSSFSLSPSGNHCTVTYNNGNQYDTAELTATIKRNNTVVKTLTKQITNVGYIAGNNTVCGTTLYNTATLPDSISVSWSTDGTLGIVSGQGSSVVTVNKQGDGNSTLTAAIKHNNDTLKVLTKTVAVGTPELDELVFYNSTGVGNYWIEGNAGNVALIPNTLNLPYDQYEIQVYRLNNQFQEVLVYQTYRSEPYIEYSNAYEGWFIVYIRGIGACGNSMWSSAEIETVTEPNPGPGPGEEPLLNISYDPEGNSLIVRLNDTAIRQTAGNKKDIASGKYEIQIWNNLRQVKSVSSNQPETRVSLADLPNGIYIAKVTKDGKSFEKKFVKMK